MIAIYPDVSPAIEEVESYFQNEVASMCEAFQQQKRAVPVLSRGSTDYLNIINTFVEEIVSKLKTEQPYEVSK
jgi:hypothetical protein